ncbi:MAG: hypothetical protein J2P36_23100 [Ktedonobacteraceae bacterium]|nr:hypothetical protein [Ktedonobacteraceae bacterium]
MLEVQSWRSLLETIIGSTKERQRLARVLNVPTATLRSWAEGKADPQIQQLYLLINALPRYRQQLLSLIANEVESTSQPEPVEEIADIPSVFYAHVLSGSTALTQPVRFWSLSNMILNQALSQLDPQHSGMSLQVVRCMPPGEVTGKVCSLRVSVSVCTSPWHGEADQQAMLLGAESLAGWAVTVRRLVVVNEQMENSAFPPQMMPRENCAAAYPIERANCVAGCLFVACAQPEYLVPARIMLIRHYANLLSLAFEPDEFYEGKQIDLQVMPALDVQLPWRSAFQRRVADTLMLATQNSSVVEVAQAEMQVWQQYEEEFLKLMRHTQG